MLAALRRPCLTNTATACCHYTFSGGVTSWDGTEVLQSVVQRADRALYRTKAGERNRVDLARRG